MKTYYEVTMDGTPIFIPHSVNKNNFDAVRDYVYRLRSEYLTKDIYLWEIAPKLVDL